MENTQDQKVSLAELSAAMMQARRDAFLQCAMQCDEHAAVFRKWADEKPPHRGKRVLDKLNHFAPARTHTGAGEKWER